MHECVHSPQRWKRLRLLIRTILPVASRRRLARLTRWPPIGWVRFGHLRRTLPISEHWGEDRGQPIDRYYIERFLAAYGDDIRGRVLEIANNTYTRRYGGNRVTRSDVLHAARGNPHATLIGDLASAEHVASNSFDCIICTQTIQVIPDAEAAVRTLYRILKPGGVLLATVPGISKIYQDTKHDWGDHWHFTARSSRWLFEKVFSPPQVSVTAHGNVLAAVAFLHGLAADEFEQRELDVCDPNYQVSITIRAVKPRNIS